MSPEEAQALERELAARPDDAVAHRRLAEYYVMPSLKAGGTGEERDRLQHHVLWLIEHAPAAPESENLGLLLLRRLDGAAWDRAKGLYEEHLRNHPDDPTLLGNAAGFLSLADMEEALSLLERARSAAPHEREWTDRIAEQLTLMGKWKPDAERSDSARRALAEMESVDGQATDVDDRIRRAYDLPALAQAAFESNELEKAEHFAREAVDPSNWPLGKCFAGQLIHDGHVILGRLALRSGDVAAAEQHLLDAGATPGSPVLGSFGPSMWLARELLEAGARETVLRYFGLCRSFWKSGDRQLTVWSEAVRRGAIPDFGFSLR